MTRRIIDKLEALKDRLEGSPRKRAEMDRQGVYRHYVQAALNDGALTNDEIQYLAQIRTQLKLDAATAKRLDHDEIIGFFKSRMRSADYQGASDAVELLKTVQRDLKNLRVKWSDVSRHLCEEIIEYLCRVFDRQWEDNYLAPEEVDAFKTICKKYGVDFEDASGHFAKRIHSELEGYLNIQFFGGELSGADMAYVQSIADAFGLGSAAKERLAALGNRLLLLSRVRRDDLPTYECPILLDSGERCVYAATGAQFMPAATNRPKPPVYGTFVITDRTLYLEAFDGGIRRMGLKGITSVNHDGRGIVVRGAKKNASGTYFVGDDELASEILFRAILAEKRHVLPNGGAQRTRSIPQSVRHEVYQRDGGRCVQCGSVQNIHFDHIIPFSRGGANSVENIQLLCASCNLDKGDRI